MYLLVKHLETYYDVVMNVQLTESTLFQLLNESEATVMRLTEQAKVLKEEIRRQERNQERETAVSNMEYLKNIVFKVCILKATKRLMSKQS